MEEKCFLHETLKFALKKIGKKFILLHVTQILKFLASQNSDFMPVFAGLPTSMSRVGSAIWYLKNTTFYFFCYCKKKFEKEYEQVLQAPIQILLAVSHDIALSTALSLL